MMSRSPYTPVVYVWAWRKPPYTKVRRRERSQTKGGRNPTSRLWLRGVRLNHSLFESFHYLPTVGPNLPLHISTPSKRTEKTRTCVRLVDLLVDNDYGPSLVVLGFKRSFNESFYITYPVPKLSSTDQDRKSGEKSRTLSSRCNPSLKTDFCTSSYWLCKYRKGHVATPGSVRHLWNYGLYYKMGNN